MPSGQQMDMRGLQALDLPPWSLPLIVVALVVPITVVAILVGPAGAFAAGFLVTFAVAVIAIRTRFDEAIEVASAPDRLHRALIVWLAPAGGKVDAERIHQKVDEAAAGFEGSATSLLLVPARNRPLAEWLSDVDAARADAERKVDDSLAWLRAAGLEVEGRAGETDIVQTIEDTLRSFPACDVIVVTDATDTSHELGELRRRLDRPIHELRVEGSQSSLP